MREAKYKLVDLFCGCGGISRGFQWTRRFATEFGVEIEAHPVQAFRANIRNAEGRPPHVHLGDIRAITATERALWHELHKAGITEPGQIDVLAGGPPCQGFSRNGVRRYEDDNKAVRFYDHPKNHLYKSFLRIVESSAPKIVFVENVREFLNFGGGKFSTDLVSRFQELGYSVKFRKVCAADFGVPQIRNRVLFVAVRRDVAERSSGHEVFPEPEFFEESTDLLIGHPYHTVRDAISDLPHPSRNRLAVLEYEENENIGQLARFLRNPAGVVANHFTRELSEKQKLRIRAIGSGRMKHAPAELRTKSFYGSAYRRLSWDEPSLTITTWVYHVGSGRFAHPEADRGLTMREAARLQTFDDAFAFPPLVNPVSQMIGNAVPPLLAYAFARKFVAILDKFHGARLIESTSGFGQGIVSAPA